MEDLDRHQASVDIEAAQLRDLARSASTGTARWSARAIVSTATKQRSHDSPPGLVYECFCTRREIREEIEAAAHAPHGPPGSYPGTCRDLTTHAAEPSGVTRAADRHCGLRTDGQEIELRRSPARPVTGLVDDVVLRRNDGVPAYNLAVVVDDAAQGVTEVVRGDDLLASTARQIHLQELLGLPPAGVPARPAGGRRRRGTPCETPWRCRSP